MRLSLVLFIMGVMFFTMGYVNIKDPKCKKEIDVKFVSRSVFDEIVKNDVKQVYEDMGGNVDFNTITIET